MDTPLSANDRTLSLLTTLFRLSFLGYAALTFCCLTFGTPLISCFMWLTLFSGGFLLLYRLWRWRQFATPFRWILVVLLSAGILSTIVNARLGLKQNLVYLMCWTFYFLLLYPQDIRLSPSKRHREARLLMIIYGVIIRLYVIISIVMLFTGFSIETSYNGGRVLGGFVDSRLYGAFVDPNAGATAAATTAFLSAHGARRCRLRWARWLLGTGTLLDLFYIALSDSRTGMVVLLVMGFTYTLLYLLECRRRKVAAFVGALIVGLGCFAAPRLTKELYNKGVALWAAQMVKHHQQNPHHSQTPEEELKDLMESLTVDRDYDLSGDISNRRFSVWKSGVELFVTRPLYGTGFAGFIPYAKETLPDTYIVNNDYRDMNTFDNEVINILVANGVLGMLPCLAFALLALTLVLRRVRRLSQELYPDATLMLTVTLGIATCAMFRSAVFYYHSPLANLFWSLLGALTALCDPKGGILDGNRH